MKYIKLFQQFIKESHLVNEALVGAIERSKKYIDGNSLTELTGSEWNSNAIDIVEPSLIWWVGPKKNKVTLHIKPSSWDSSYILVSLVGINKKDSTDGSNELVIFEKGFKDIKSLVSEFKKVFGISLDIDPRFAQDYKNWLNDIGGANDVSDLRGPSSKAKEQLARREMDLQRDRMLVRNKNIS